MAVGGFINFVTTHQFVFYSPERDFDDINQRQNMMSLVIFTCSREHLSKVQFDVTSTFLEIGVVNFTPPPEAVFYYKKKKKKKKKGSFFNNSRMLCEIS